jgi:hypothetical protein
MDEIAAAVREGRIDHHHAAIPFLRGDPGPPRRPGPPVALEAAAAAAEEEQDEQDDDDDQQQGAEPHGASLRRRARLPGRTGG